MDHHSDPPVITFRAGEPVVEVSHADRLAAGLDHWVDGTMGIHRRDGRTLVIAPNGPTVARHQLGDGGFVKGLVTADQPIVSADASIDHSSGGPLLYDAESGLLLLIYHAERFADGDPMRFYSFLGLAASSDEGVTFRDLGPIVRPSVTEGAVESRPIEIGPGGAVVRDGYVYVYFTERSSWTEWVRLGVARAPVEEVFGAARRAEVPEFAKYHSDAFGEPALGGRATDLLAGCRYAVLWFDVAHLVREDLTLLVFSTVTSAGDHRGGWVHVGCCSRDGLRWSTPQPLTDTFTSSEMLYLTIDSGGADQRRIESDGFDLYRVVSTTPFRWDDAWLERVAVQWSLGGTAAPPPD